MQNSTKGKIIKASALVVDVAAPLITTLTLFPVWIEQSAEATVSGVFLVFAILSIIPLMKFIGKWLKSPSVWILWAVLLVLFVALRNIIDQMCIIALIGLIGNVIGAILYKVGNKFDPPAPPTTTP